MPDIALQVQATQALPLNYTVPGGQIIVLKSARASFDGAAAAGNWVPAIVLKDTYGNEAGCYVLNQTLASGVSADVSFFPGQIGASLTGIFYDIVNAGADLTIEVTNASGGVTWVDLGDWTETVEGLRTLTVTGDDTETMDGSYVQTLAGGAGNDYTQTISMDNITHTEQANISYNQALEAPAGQLAIFWTGLPTTLPGGSKQIWNNAGLLSITP